MFKDTAAFSGFAVDDLDAARAFYTDILGLDVTEVIEVPGGLLQLNIAGGPPVLVYPKPDFTPASYTILNFPGQRHPRRRGRARRHGRRL